MTYRGCHAFGHFGVNRCMGYYFSDAGTMSTFNVAVCNALKFLRIKNIKKPFRSIFVRFILKWYSLFANKNCILQCISIVVNFKPFEVWGLFLYLLRVNKIGCLLHCFFATGN